MYKTEENTKSIYARFIKRALDIITALAGLIILAIPMAVAALAIKLCDGGKIIFAQARVGCGSKEFICYKFRTMSADAPSDCATRELDDPQKYITKVGRFLRRTSIDELPQLINVLLGDMSIVGPRPVIPNEAELIELRRILGVYSVRPGITGEAQVRGRDSVGNRRKAAYDARYVENISFFGDIALLCQTFFCVILGIGVKEGADGMCEEKKGEGTKGRFISALTVAFGAQGVTAAVSALTVFFLAGKLDAAEYGRWQLYSLAASYSGLFQLGLCDGIYLRLGGKKREELEYPILGGQFRRMILFELLCSGLIIFAVTAFWDGARASALCGAALYMPIFNSTAFLGYILQATGRTALYSLSTIIDRVAFALFAVSAAIFGSANYLSFIAAAIFAKLISLLFCVLVTREVVFASKSEEGIWRKTSEDISSGGRLMVANLSGHSICGAAKLAVVSAYGDAEFGRVSFVMTLSMLLVQFTSQFAMVIFPSLKREEGEKREAMLTKLNVASGLFLPVILLSYLPIKYVVESYLPQYAEGLLYLPILLALCMFEGRACLVGGTYHKVMRLEARLLKINLICAAIGAIVCFFSAYTGGGTESVLISALIITALRAYLLDPVTIRSPIQGVTDHLSSAALCAVFITSVTLLSGGWGTFTFLAFYLWYLFLRRDSMRILDLKMKKKAIY